MHLCWVDALVVLVAPREISAVIEQPLQSSFKVFVNRHQAFSAFEMVGLRGYGMGGSGESVGYRQPATLTQQSLEQFLVEADQQGVAANHGGCPQVAGGTQHGGNGFGVCLTTAEFTDFPALGYIQSIRSL